MRKYYSPKEIAAMSLEDMLDAQKAPLQPYYTRETTQVVHSLRYDWNGWPSGDAVFPETISTAVELCRSAWLKDGFTLGEWRTKEGLIQCLFDVSPEIAPTEFTRKVKGRIDNALRKLGTPMKFSRKVSMRSLGDNTRKIVEGYVAKQVRKSDYVDERFKKILGEFTEKCGEIDLSEPYRLAHSSYWYNIHLVIVVDDRRIPIATDDNLRKIKSVIPRIAEKKKCEVAGFSVMPDHIHIALKGNPEMSPMDIGLGFMNNLAHVFGMRCWNREFYVGTFSEYTVNQVG